MRLLDLLFKKKRREKKLIEEQERLEEIKKGKEFHEEYEKLCCQYREEFRIIDGLIQGPWSATLKPSGWEYVGLNLPYTAILDLFYREIRYHDGHSPYKSPVVMQIFPRDKIVIFYDKYIELAKTDSRFKPVLDYFRGNDYKTNLPN